MTVLPHAHHLDSRGHSRRRRLAILVVANAAIGSRVRDLSRGIRGTRTGERPSLTSTISSAPIPAAIPPG